MLNQDGPERPFIFVPDVAINPIIKRVPVLNALRADSNPFHRVSQVGVHLDHGSGQTREPILPRALVSQEVFDSAQVLRLNDRVATFSSTTFPRRPTLVLPPLFQSSLHISSDGLVKVRRQLFKLLRRHFHAVKPTAPLPCENTWCAE